MRLAFFDESGTGSYKNDPSVIVAGVIVHADSQLLKVEKHLTKLCERFLPPEFRDHPFHASEIFGRRGPVFGKDAPLVSEADRQQLIKEMMAIPDRFGLVIVWCEVEKDAPSWANEPPAEKTLAAHATAMTVCAVTVDTWMHDHAIGEVCQLIVEQTDHARKKIEEMQKFMCAQNVLATEGLDPKSRHYLPIKHVRRSVLFEPKTQPSLLAVADLCAYVIYKCRKTSGQHYFTALGEQLEKNVYAAPRRWEQ